MYSDSTKRLSLEDTWSGRAAARAIPYDFDETDGFLWPGHLAAGPQVSSLAKRAFDVTLALILLVLTAPVLLLAMFVIELTSLGPAIFVQKRIGFQGQIFRMYKLRTMRHGADEMENVLADCLDGRTFLKIENDPRVTWIGRLLRNYSIDELPQLWNVLRGDMSLVGPRPILLCDFRKFPKREQLRRFSVKPGVTGLWQVSGRSLVSDEERIRLDLEYVDRWSLGLDLAILARTLPVVLTAKGAT
jgi:lipopolysaccharide/colanic/teichoic acid biosynthesis glycosyltransferase